MYIFNPFYPIKNLSELVFSGLISEVLYIIEHGQNKGKITIKNVKGLKMALTRPWPPRSSSSWVQSALGSPCRRVRTRTLQGWSARWNTHTERGHSRSLVHLSLFISICVSLLINLTRPMGILCVSLIRELRCAHEKRAKSITQTTAQLGFIMYKVNGSSLKPVRLNTSQ